MPASQPDQGDLSEVELTARMMGTDDLRAIIALLQAILAEKELAVSQRPSYARAHRS